MTQLLLALSAQVGGVSRLVAVLAPEARRTPASPRELAEIVARKRDVVLSLETWNAMLTLPDEWIGELSDEEPGSGPPP
jgi:hypothetical protein